MAFPAVVGTAESATTSAGTSHTVNLPSGAAGNLLLIIGSSVAASTFTLSGWTELLDENTARGGWAAAKIADGTEGATVSVSSSASIKPAFIAYEISGAADPATTPPTFSTTATGASLTPDPDNCNPGVADDYLWIAWFTLAGEEADDDTWGNTSPTNYTPSPPRQKTAGTAGTSTSAVIASAERQLNASAENPGTFDIDATVNNSWRAITMAIHPASLVDADAEVSWTEFEVPNAQARADISWSELEVPNAQARADISWSEFEVPNAESRADVAWTEFEVPNPPGDPADAEVSFAEFEVPNASANAEVSWAEFEVPTAESRADVSWAEFEVPTASAAGEISWAEFETPNTPARADISWAEFEVPEVGAGQEANAYQQRFIGIYQNKRRRRA